MEKAVSKLFPQYTFMSVEQKFVFLLSHSYPQINNSVAAYMYTQCILHSFNYIISDQWATLARNGHKNYYYYYYYY